MFNLFLGNKLLKTKPSQKVLGKFKTFIGEDTTTLKRKSHQENMTTSNKCLPFLKLKLKIDGGVDSPLHLKRP